MVLSTRDALLHVARLYSTSRGISLARISTLAANDGKVLARIGAGRDISTATHDRILGWLSSHWPSSLEWPAEISRPAVPGHSPGQDAA